MVLGDTCWWWVHTHIDGNLGRIAIHPWISSVAILNVIWCSLIVDSFLDPCYYLACDRSKKCTVKSPTLAVCECVSCPYNYAPVCASDGHTYANECLMVKKSCELGEKYFVVKRNVCGKYQKLNFDYTSIVLHSIYIKSLQKVLTLI